MRRARTIKFENETATGYTQDITIRSVKAVISAHRNGVHIKLTVKTKGCSILFGVQSSYP